MRKHLLYLTFTFIVAAFATSCKKDDDIAKATESKVVQGSIMGVNGPTSGLVDQELTFSLVWQNTDGTLKLHHLQDSVANDTTMVKLFTLTNIADTTAAAKNLSIASYKFKAAKPGTYYLKFYKADSTGKAAIIDTLNIK
ncbi:hypothetical protein HQ865_14675 [Mucilaginibacter mali]|uniref:Uncharacterized protein n=1 Tax=Mucilaginibacter mali TaxID=2740462 RepID=A0A7D4UMD0_9SPHI|nr:hypothetical protein [Mucilaginibacter mali]QKJ30941.1 hypothetical protein HQ865_14675 [Mucilaginibacter mali]